MNRAMSFVACGVWVFAANVAIAAQINNRSGIIGTDALNWHSAPGSGGSSFTTSTVNGIGVTVSGTASMTFATQVGPGSCGTYPVNFAPCDRTLLNGNVSFSNPITLSFATLVSGGGAQFADAATYGPIVARLTAYDSLGNVLESYTRNGVTNGNADDSAIFLGIQRSQADIAKLEFNLTSSSTFFFFGINRVSVSTAVTPIPEPQTWALFALGLVAVAFRSRSRSQRV
jgi:hypothetical protein